MRTTERSQTGGGTVYLTTDAQTARQRLAAYEDTGLEPEQVAALIATVRAMLREFDAAKKSEKRRDKDGLLEKKSAEG